MVGGKIPNYHMFVVCDRCLKRSRKKTDECTICKCNPFAIVLLIFHTDIRSARKKSHCELVALFFSNIFQKNENGLVSAGRAFIYGYCSVQNINYRHQNRSLLGFHKNSQSVSILLYISNTYYILLQKGSDPLDTDQEKKHLWMHISISSALKSGRCICQKLNLTIMTRPTTKKLTAHFLSQWLSCVRSLHVHWQVVGLL
jgi:hypothetical protein